MPVPVAGGGGGIEHRRRGGSPAVNRGEEMTSDVAATYRCLLCGYEAERVERQLDADPLLERNENGKFVPAEKQYVWQPAPPAYISNSPACCGEPMLFLGRTPLD